MIRKRIFQWSTILSILLTVQCTIDDDQITSPVGGIDQYIAYKSFQADDDKYQVFTYGDSTQVELSVIKSDGDPAPGFTVNFTAENNLGSITPSDTTDDSGIAAAKYYSYSTPGIEIITASTGNKKDSLLLYLVNRVTSLALSINDDSTAILADGKANVKITATAKDSLDNPQANLRIFFTTDHGTIPVSGLTDENGIAEVNLTSKSDSLDVIATVRAGFEQFESMAAKTNALKNQFKGLIDEQDIRSFRPLKKERPIEIGKPGTQVSAAKVIATASSLEDTLQVTFKGIELNVQRGIPVILADGEDLADIVVTIIETTTGNPITNYDFNITATKGTIIGNTITDETGRANLQLRSGTKAGISVITVSVGLVSAQTEIELQSANPSSFTVERSAQFGIADGISGITLTATVLDTLNNPVEAEEVVFSATAGELDITSGLTNTNGQVTAFLTSIPSVYDSTSTVIASVSGYPELIDTVEVEFKGITISAGADPDTIVANGLQSTIITATVRRTTGFAGAIPDREVHFISLSGLGSIESPQITNSNGVATAELTAGLFEGTEIILIAFGEMEPDTVYVEFLPQGATILELVSDLQNVHADGVSVIELTATATDTLDNPVSGIWIYFNSNIPDHDQMSALTDIDGTAIIDFPSFASNSNLSAWLYASLTADNQAAYIPGGGYSLASKTAQLIRMNTPAPLILTQDNQTGELIDSVAVEFIGITVTAEAEDTLLVADGLNTTTIFAEIKETETNITVGNQPVYFTTNHGTITPENFTDDFGIAEAVLTSARFPDTANIRVRYGASLYDTVSVEYLTSDPVSISILADQTSILANGLETDTISALVLDILGNPMQGEAVGFTTDLGSLSANAAYSDENGLARVNLYSIADVNTHIATVTATISSNSVLTDSMEIEFRGLTINTTASEMSITADSQSSTDITVALAETANLFPIANQEVNFLPTNTNGNMPRTVTTDINGIAISTLTSGTLPGTAKIYISTGNNISGEVLEDSISIELLNHSPNQIIVNADEASILADGSSSTGISTQVVDTLGNPVAGINVNLNTTFGNLTSNSGSTDEDGIFNTILTSTPDSIDHNTEIIAVCTNFSHITDTAAITMRGLTLIINADPEQISADGSSISTIDINLRETGNNNPIPNTNIILATSSGTIPSLTTTNSMGLAEAQLTSNTEAGQAIISATAGITRLTTVQFISAAPNSIQVDADLSSMLANGLSTTDVIATVEDVLGNPVTGTLLGVSTNIGQLSNSFIYTDANGDATVTLTSSASTTDTNAVVIYTVINDTLSLSDSGSVEFRGITLSIEADPTQIPANGSATATISAGLSETTRGNPLIGATIDWSTTLGIIPTSSITDNLGFASAVLTAGTITGTATVTGAAGVTNSTTIDLLPPTPSILLLTESSNSIIADGEAATSLQVTLSDVLGIPLDGIQINLSTSFGSTGLSTVTTDNAGEATFNFISDTSTTDQVANVIAAVADYPTVADTVIITNRGITLDISAEPNQIPADGNSSSTIAMGMLETTNGNPVSNRQITLMTDLGSIPAAVTTNDLGHATTILTSGILPGQATVTANAGVINSTNISILSITPTSINVIASSSSILADGEATTTLTATVADTLGNPVSGAVVGFTTDDGTLSGNTAATNTNGEATIVLTSSADVTDVTSEVMATVSSFPDVKDSLDMVFRGLNLSISADPNQIPADGISTSSITVDLLETTSGNPVSDKTIICTTDLGSIQSTATTDASGHATANLLSGIVAGTASVNITAGVTGSTAVEFVSVAPNTITMTASTTSIIADNLATTIITATVSDTLGNPIAGTVVNFTTGAGTLSSTSVTTDADGFAAVTLTGTARTSDTTIVAAAAVSGYPAVNNNISIDFRGLTLQVNSDPTQIPADGQSIAAITVNLTETTNGNPVVNRVLGATTNLGTIPAQGITGTTGQANIILTAGASAGTATVNIDAGVSGSTAVDFMSIEPKSISLSASETSILADNSAATTITAIVTDTLNIPIAGTAVNFASGAGTLSSTSVTTDDDGLAAVTQTGTARTIDTTVVTAAAVSGYPAVNNNISIDFRGLTLTVTADPDEIAADGNSTSTITIELIETTNGNPVAEKPAILTTNRGIIANSITTDANGTASSILTSGTTAGTATVNVSAGVSGSTAVEFRSIVPNAVAMSTSETSILADQADQVVFTVLVTDILDNPLTGIALTFTTDYGTLSSLSATTDTNGQAALTLTGSASTTDLTTNVKTVLTDYSSIRDSIDIDLRGITIDINASPTRIPADGVSTSAVTVDLRETTNGNPVTSRGVNLSTTKGTIVASDTTDADGSLTTNLTSSSSSGTATVTAIAGVIDSIEVEFSDLSFTVTADGTTLLADGVSSLQVRAQLQDQVTGNPLIDKTVYWTTTLGTIPASSVTDDDGEALADLTAGLTAGTAKVKGYYGINMVDSVSININVLADSIIILSWYNPGGNPSDGTDILSITVILSDENGNPVNGNTIAFSVAPTSYGSITTGVATGADGTATANYTYSSQFAGQTVRVQATSQSGDITNFIDIILPEAN